MAKYDGCYFNERDSVNMEVDSRRHRRALRATFFREHPHCVFCGGDARATTEDHVPARAIFTQRQWPEGMVFPACGPCNGLTRKDEIIIAMVSRLFPDAQDRVTKAETIDAIKNAERNFPGLLESMRPKATDVRKFLRERGNARPHGTLLSDIPVLRVGGPAISNAIERYGIKIGCALHYARHKRIVPPHGALLVKWFTNVQMLDGEIPEKVTQLLDAGPNMIRSKKTLNDQFSYGHATTEDSEAGVYFAVFRKSFAIVTFVYMDAKNAPSQYQEHRHPPFNHR